MLSSLAVVPTTSIRVKESPYILASHSTASMTTPRLNGTALEVDKGFVHRIHRACSTWPHFHQSLEKAKRILEQNQYPPAFYDPLIRQTLQDILVEKEQSQKKQTPDTTNITKKIIKVQYRGKSTEDYARALHKINAPCTIVMTLRKLKTALPSLKPPIEKVLKSGIVYELQCPRCTACYVGQTGRHLQIRLKEHLQQAQ